ncbi:MAG: hypothetical protein GJ676_14665 [Rhodobacteraceae bacterium]|nr:hypothetical protein [Paracoccaceae bacterium]
MALTSITPNSNEVFDDWLGNRYWSGSTITYSFPTNGSFYSYQPTNQVTSLSNAQKNAVRAALSEIASFTGLTFVEVTETNSTEATMRFATEVGLGGGYAYLPSNQETGGDVFMGSGTTNPIVGNEDFLFFTHEIGHAMGLLHGHEYPDFVATGLDSQEYTVVTYTDYVGDTDTFSYDSGPIDWAQSYQQLDIAAMQFLYGANYSPTGEIWSGNTVYSFNATTGEMSINGVGQGTPAGNRIFRTIWDGHGNDTYDLSNYTTDLEIDLGPGAFSTFSNAQLADLNRLSPDPEYLAAGNVANARLVAGDVRALIENAIGGSGADKITGNQADNILTGNRGKDKLFGLDGDDRLVGNGGRDKLVGGRDDDRLLGGNGNDKLLGGNGRDELFGGQQNDDLLGQLGNDVLRGGAGNDNLTGGRGKDVMFGDSGLDMFVFTDVSDSARGNPSDVIKDFTVGADKIDLQQIAAGTLGIAINGSFDGLNAMVITSISGGNTIVRADVDGDGVNDFKVLVQNTTGLSASDFLL